MSRQVLVYGVGVAGLATARALVRRGVEVVAIDDRVDAAKSAAPAAVGVELRLQPKSEQLERLVTASAFVAPAPGVPENHLVVDMARRHGIPLKSELDLAYDWEQGRPGGPRPMLAVTGTDGKTTTVTMVESMLRSAGMRAIACGNTDIPLVEAVDEDVDVFVVEATSFRLCFAETFRAEASAWINLAPDHLDWHSSMSTYEAAKARLWSNVGPSDTVVGFLEDPVVMAHLRRSVARQITFSDGSGDYHRDAANLIGPAGTIMEVAEMRRSLPHDITNALAASALVLESGLASVSAVRESLGGFVPPHHRIELVADHEGVRWFDDSKATTPHAAVTAIRGFDSVILIAGGRNKGLDLSPMAAESGRVRAVVALGESAAEVESVFSGRVPVSTVGSMRDAVLAAARHARASDVVLLSPGCTSLDWYTGYAARGDDFVRNVRELIGGVNSDASSSEFAAPPSKGSRT
ncbi:MAG: UDP-N-acetylmuramoyl-L-alanine--D-glutamate ligase [Actinomycetota bacterium]